MCGIVGYVGSSGPKARDALEVVISGLEKLEYRGYDSAGVAVLRDGKISVTRAVGKLSELKKLLDADKTNTKSNIGIGHTRWATHGKPSEDNAHPHTAGTISLIHNGIIENYLELRTELKKEGCKFLSETDTEIAAHLLNQSRLSGKSPLEALKETCKKIRGSYSFLAIDSSDPEMILVAKTATPIVIGIGEGEVIVASDIPAVLPYTRKVMILEDGDIAEVSLKRIYIENEGNEITRPVQTITWDPVTAQKGGFKHYMLKEIHDQVSVVADTFRGRATREKGGVFLPEITLTADEIKSIDRIVLVACGTAWHACLVGKFYFERFAKIPCEVDYASEFRYRDATLSKNTLVLAISQSGETADTLAAIDAASKISKTASICNVLGSSLARKVPNTLFTHAGPEISVASTKAFSTQLVAVYLLALHFGAVRGVVGAKEVAENTEALTHLPHAIDVAVKGASQVEKLAKTFHRARDFLFLGRGICYPIALEGALKLKEISYIHAEGYPAGEIKHGPLALIDESMPVVVILNRSSILEKTISNLKEVESRGGQLLCITDAELSPELRNSAVGCLDVPFVSEYLSPIVLNIPLQLLAYYVAVLNGTDVDLPRNLAKSVTVE